MAEEITTKKIEDLGENMEPADADVFLFGASGGNIIKKIKWGNLMKKLKALLFVNNRTTTEEGFGLDARQGKLIQDELDQLNTKINDCLSNHCQKNDTSYQSSDQKIHCPYCQCSSKIKTSWNHPNTHFSNSKRYPHQKQQQ